MKNRIFQIIASFIVLVLLVTPLAGCSSDDSQVSDDDPYVCPDDSVVTDTYALSSERDTDGSALGMQTVFTPDTPEIVVTLWLSRGLCCALITVRWTCNDEIIETWEINGDASMGHRVTTSLRKTGDEFATGDYKVEAFLWIRPLFEIPFTVE